MERQGRRVRASGKQGPRRGAAVRAPRPRGGVLHCCRDRSWGSLWHPEGKLADDAWFRRGEELARSFDAAFGQPAKPPAPALLGARAVGSPAGSLARGAANRQRGTASHAAAMLGQAGAQQESRHTGVRTAVLRCKLALEPVPEPRAGGRGRDFSGMDAEALAEGRAPTVRLTEKPTTDPVPPAGREPAGVGGDLAGDQAPRAGDFGESELAPAGQGTERHGHG